MSLHWELSYARGYIGLQMYKEAEARLDVLPASMQGRTEILAVRVALYQASEDWEKLRETAGQLAHRQPDEPSWWVALAYATRRCRSIIEARSVLEQARRHHPGEAIILYNLGCYAARMGELPQARTFLDQAIEIDPSCHDMAKKDEDFEPLREAELL